ncbi:MAG: DUF6268 family outer membrane beta-barrel protein [Myxococcota bacterium]
MEGTFQPAVGSPGEDLRASDTLFDFRGQVNIPIQIQPKGYWVLIPGFEYLGGLFRPDIATDLPIRGYHDIGLSLLTFHRLGSKGRWFLAGRGEPIMAISVGEQTTDFRVRGVASLVVLYRFGPELMLGLGASVIADRDFVIAVPVVVARWRPTSRFMLEANLPRGVSGRYRLFDGVEVGGRFILRGRRVWNADQDLLDSPERAFRLITMTVQATLGLRMTDKLWLEIGAGTSVFEQSRAEVPGDDITRQFQPNGRFTAGVTYRLR